MKQSRARILFRKFPLIINRTCVRGKKLREIVKLTSFSRANYHILVVRQTDSDIFGLPPRLHLEMIFVALHDHGHRGGAVLGFYTARGCAKAVLGDVAARIERVLLILRLQRETHTAGMTRGNFYQGARCHSARYEISVVCVARRDLRGLRNILSPFVKSRESGGEKKKSSEAGWSFRIDDHREKIAYICYLLRRSSHFDI